MKKLSLSISLVLFLFSLCLTGAFAEEFDQAYMVSGFGNATEKLDAYILGQDQPWFYIKFVNSLTDNIVVGNSTLTAKWIWDNPSGTDISYPKIYTNNQNEIWGSLENWTSREELGNWSISFVPPSYLIANSASGIQGVHNYVETLNFKVSNVVPEPASALLYILGGGSLIAGFFRRKKA